MIDAARRPLPDFVILGAQRAGTTTLYAALAEHPQVRPALVKEIHFFDRNYARGLPWYRAHFSRGAPGTIAGEATPYYLFHPDVPERVAGALPAARFVVLLRDPVARAWSHYHHERSRGREPLTFQEAVDTEEERLGRDAVSHQRFSYLARGRYAEQLERWFAAVPRERFLVIASETLFGSPDETYAKVVSFLGLPPLALGHLPREGTGSYAPLDRAIEERLRLYFAPHDERLRRLLGKLLPWMPG
jgi:hypothetical protein